MFTNLSELMQVCERKDEASRLQCKRGIARLSIEAELDAINLYETMATLTGDGDMQQVLLDVAREEKTHVGEFTGMLNRFDEEQREEMQKGKEEVIHIIRE